MNEFVELQNNMLSQVSVSAQIIGGQIYSFRYRAINRQGLGVLSEQNYFKAANVANQISPATTTELGT